MAEDELDLLVKSLACCFRKQFSYGPGRNADLLTGIDTYNRTLLHQCINSALPSRNSSNLLARILWNSFPMQMVRAIGWKTLGQHRATILKNSPSH